MDLGWLPRWHYTDNVRGKSRKRNRVSLARTVINTTANPNLIVPNQALNSAAYAFPNVKNQFQEVRLDTSYAISKNVRLGAMYRFEPYRISDFASDVISPSNPG